MSEEQDKFAMFFAACLCGDMLYIPIMFHPCAGPKDHNSDTTGATSANTIKHLQENVARPLCCEQCVFQLKTCRNKFMWMLQNTICERYSRQITCGYAWVVRGHDGSQALEVAIWTVSKRGRMHMRASCITPQMRQLELCSRTSAYKPCHTSASSMIPHPLLHFGAYHTLSSFEQTHITSFYNLRCQDCQTFFWKNIRIAVCVP